VPRAYGSLDELLSDPAVQVVHVTSPNVAHYPQVRAILAAGRHVVCEKPLAMTSAQSAEMRAQARASGKVAAVCYNTRFYPLNQHAHAMMAAGDLGALRLVTGQFHQDWLAKDTDWNWRLEA
jgi:predicted dehydrogenase